VIPAIIETQRLRLVGPSIECFSAYDNFYTDQEASKAYGGPISTEQAWARLKADLGSWSLLGFGVWVIQEKESGQFVGTCGFWQGKDWPKELTWWLLPQARRKGIAYEASLAVINHAYNKFAWSSVETYMNDDNVAARALVKKLGGYKKARAEFPDGLTRDVYFIPNPALQDV